MCGAQNIWSSLMDCSVDEESCFVQNLHFAVVENVSFVINPKQITFVDHVEVHAEWIDLVGLVSNMLREELANIPRRCPAQSGRGL